jgi:hypothetical protein
VVAVVGLQLQAIDFLNDGTGVSVLEEMFSTKDNRHNRHYS